MRAILQYLSRTIKGFVHSAQFDTKPRAFAITCIGAQPTKSQRVVSIADKFIGFTGYMINNTARIPFTVCQKLLTVSGFEIGHGLFRPVHVLASTGLQLTASILAGLLRHIMTAGPEMAAKGRGIKESSQLACILARLGRCSKRCMSRHRLLRLEYGPISGTIQDNSFFLRS